LAAHRRPKPRTKERSRPPIPAKGPRVGLIVEGPSEREAFRQLPKLISGCPTLDLASRKRSDLEGVGGSVDPATLARMVVPKIILLRPDNDRVVVCIDREDRTEEANDFAQRCELAIRDELGARGEPRDGVEVIVADRAFEAWLLADLKGLCGKKNVKPRRNRCYEAYQNGKDFGARVLASHFGRYDKRDDGPKLFAFLDLAAARLDCTAGKGWGSRSLDRFLATLGV